MKVVITGGCGFIGTNLAWHLSELGYTVKCVDNFSVGKANHMPPIKILQRDVTNLEDCLEFTRNEDYVIHLAAISGVEISREQPGKCWQTNLIGTTNVLDASGANGVRQVVIASSGAVEDRFSSPYALSKWTAEYVAKLHPQDSCILRFANVYGPYSEHKTSVINRSLWRIKKRQYPIIYGDGSHSRDFIHVKDVCKAVELAMLSDCEGPYNIATGSNYTIKGLMRQITATTGNGFKPKVYPEKAGEVSRVYVETEQAFWELGFRAEIGLNEGLKMTWESIQSQ